MQDSCESAGGGLIET